MKGLLSVLFFFLLASKTYSWWSAGHMLTAQIAKFELISKGNFIIIYFLFLSFKMKNTFYFKIENKKLIGNEFIL